MKKILLMCIALITIQVQASKLDEFVQQTDVFLKHAVKNGLVDYTQVKLHQTTLKKLVDQIEVMNTTKDANVRNEAFYINAYNLLVIYSVIHHYPNLKQPLDVEGFFDRKKHKIAGEFLTLNDIENKKLREVYKDPRLHFVLVCAAKGCPKITNFSYKPALLEKQLVQQTKKAINDVNFIRVKPKSGLVLVSEIFKWYKVDFVSGEDIQPLMKFLNQYRETSIDTSLKIDFYPYNWTLNDVK